MPERTNATLMSEAEQKGDEMQPLVQLERRILQAVEQLRAARRERGDAQKEAARLREQLASSERRVKELTVELDSLRVERQQVASRLEKLVSQIDLLVNE